MKLRNYLTVAFAVLCIANVSFAGLGPIALKNRMKEIRMEIDKGPNGYLLLTNGLARADDAGITRVSNLINSLKISNPDDMKRFQREFQDDVVSPLREMVENLNEHMATMIDNGAKEAYFNRERAKLLREAEEEEEALVVRGLRDEPTPPPSPARPPQELPEAARMASSVDRAAAGDISSAVARPSAGAFASAPAAIAAPPAASRPEDVPVRAFASRPESRGAAAAAAASGLESKYNAEPAAPAAPAGGDVEEEGDPFADVPAARPAGDRVS